MAGILFVASLPACENKITGGPEGSVAFRVSKFNDGDDWGEAARIPFTDQEKIFAVSIEPVGGNFDGWVTIDVQPGHVTSITCNPPDCTAACDPARVINNNAKIPNTRVDLCVGVSLSFGNTRILAKDIGFEPASPASAACADGIDNDGDGKVDYGDDEGCAYTNDNTEEGGDFIVGASPEILYENPRIEHVQGHTSYSPLDDQAVTMTAGTMVVTSITTEGFFVTDINPMRPGEGYNHMFAYNYNTPWGMRECDILTLLDGIVGEFFGFTELGFPTWQVLDPDGRVEVPASSDDCPIPEPVTLTPEILSDPFLMESLESGLARIENGKISTRFISCDLNGDSVVEYTGPEGECQDECSIDPDCTELTQYFKYGQWALSTEGMKIFVISHEAYPDFDPASRSGQTIQLIRGTIRHIEFVEPPWIMEIRCKDDLVKPDEEIMPMYQACVPTQPRGQHFDNN